MKGPMLLIWLLPALALLSNAQVIDLRKNSPPASHSAHSTPQKTSGFEFRGLKPGMHQTEISSVLGVEVACMNLDSAMAMRAAGWLCLDPHGHQGLSVTLGPSGGAWEIEYDFEQGPTESIDSFTSAFTAKYGKPEVGTNFYRNGLGNQVTGLQHSWHQGTQTLKIQEICEKLNESCIRLSDAIYAPKVPTPKI